MVQRTQYHQSVSYFEKTNVYRSMRKNMVVMTSFSHDVNSFDHHQISPSFLSEAKTDISDPWDNTDKEND